MTSCKDGYKEKKEPTTAVADQRAVWALYSELVQVIQKSGLEQHKNANVPVVEELSY